MLKHIDVISLGPGLMTGTKRKTSLCKHTEVRKEQHTFSGTTGQPIWATRFEMRVSSTVLRTL